MKKVCACAAAAVLLSTFIVIDSRYNLDVTEYSISFENLPEAFDGCKIALVSDLHGWSFGKDNSRLIKAIKAADPDIIAITGDMVSKEADFEAVEKLMAGIRGLAPCYYVNGNHEWGGHFTGRMEALMEEHGAKALSNEYEALEKDGARIIVCGVEDKNGAADMIKPPALAEKLRAKHPDDFVLWLYHRNDSFIYYPGIPVDLILSGHAHGGIVRLPFVGGLLDVRGKVGASFDKGIYSDGQGARLLVSRGLGNAVFIPRFLNRPELPIITLRSSEK